MLYVCVGDVMDVVFSEDERGDHMEETFSRAGLMTAL